MNTQITGMRGVYLVAQQLCKLGFIVSPTSRGAQGADLLTTDRNCQRAYTVQVKTNTTGSFWLVGKNVRQTISRTHIYVFVRIRDLQNGESIEYYVVPSKKVGELAYLDAKKGEKENIRRTKMDKYRDNWGILGEP